MKDLDEGVNFEWPTKEKFDTMPLDTHLLAITLKSGNGDTYPLIASLQIYLSNDISSPLFECSGNKSRVKKLQFND